LWSGRGDAPLEMAGGVGVDFDFDFDFGASAGWVESFGGEAPDDVAGLMGSLGLDAR
jgi:hypothetical protein